MCDGKIEALDHVQLAMPSGGEPEARAFYEGILGIPEISKPAHLVQRGGAWFQRDGIKIHLGVESEFRASRKAHPAFLVSNLQALIATLEQAGIRTVRDEPLEGYDRVYISDPFGNRIELMEMLAPSVSTDP